MGSRPLSEPRNYAAECEGESEHTQAPGSKCSSTVLSLCYAFFFFVPKSLPSGIVVQHEAYLYVLGLHPEVYDSPQPLRSKATSGPHG